MSSRFLVSYILTFVNGLSFTILIPIFPFLIKIYNAPEIFLGILISAFSLFQLFGAPVLWALSDKYGRKPILLLTQFWTFSSWVLLGISYFVPDIMLSWVISLPILVILISRIFDWITGWNMSVIQAMVSDLTTKEERSIVFWKNSAIMGLSIIVWPSIWALSLSTPIGYLCTALVWGWISLAALIVMFFTLKESLPEEKQKKEVKISYRKLNIFSQLKKWSKNEDIKFAISMKFFLHITFVSYTTIVALYLIDRFGFSPSFVWYYLMFTWSFLIFHQSVTLKHFLKKVWDFKAILTAVLFMWFSYLAMALADNIVLFTFFYFFAVFGVSTYFTSLQGFLSKSVDERSQGEIMWFSTSIDSFISIFVPILITLVYGMINFSIFFIISAIPFIGISIIMLAFPHYFQRKTA